MIWSLVLDTDFRLAINPCIKQKRVGSAGSRIPDCQDHPAEYSTARYPPSSICAAVKASGPSVRIPGESSAKTAAARVAADELPIPAKIWASIQHTAANGI